MARSCSPGRKGWRIVYEKILESPDLKEYLVGRLGADPGLLAGRARRQSMDANYAAVNRRIAHRAASSSSAMISGHGITRLPKEDEIRPWIESQHNHGIWILLVRESDLDSESDLLADIGIYGTRAVGTQELDDRSRTVRFTLTFDPQAVRLKLGNGGTGCTCSPLLLPNPSGPRSTNRVGSNRLMGDKRGSVPLPRHGTDRANVSGSVPNLHRLPYAGGPGRWIRLLQSLSATRFRRVSRRTGECLH